MDRISTLLVTTGRWGKMMMMMMMMVVVVVVIRASYHRPQHISVTLLRKAINQENLLL
jgi:hypothetical protein